MDEGETTECRTYPSVSYLVRTVTPHPFDVGFLLTVGPVSPQGLSVMTVQNSLHTVDD